jgi:DNA-binding response OmpR family regulator
VTQIKTLPGLWLISDARNDAGLERALARLPRGSGFIYRHYHLPDPERFARFRALRRIAKARGHTVILADSALTAREWALFDAFLARPGQLLSKAQLEDNLYAFGTEIESNTIEVYIARLRKKIGHDRILTERGLGYRLVREG